MTYLKFASLRTKRPFNYVKILILLCLPFNTALAVEINSTDFESGFSSDGSGFIWRDGSNSAISTEKAKSGTSSVKFTFPGGAEGTDAFSERRFSLGGHYSDIWIKYDIYIPLNYTHRTGPGSENNKGFVHLWSGVQSTYAGDTRTGPLYGPNFWPSGSGSSIQMWVGTRINNVGQGVSFNGPNVPVITANDKGHWMTIVVHAKLATAANNDGVYELWKTDWQGTQTKILNIHNGPYYSTQNDGSPQLGFNQGYLLGWANSGFDNDTIIYIDNFKASTTSLLSDSGLAPPNPPLLFSSN